MGVCHTALAGSNIPLQIRALFSPVPRYVGYPGAYAASPESPTVRCRVLPQLSMEALGIDENQLGRREMKQSLLHPVRKKGTSLVPAELPGPRCKILPPLMGP